MIYFNCDYTEGAHPRILEQLCATNLTQSVGYGEDEFCGKARELIREACRPASTSWWAARRPISP